MLSSLFSTLFLCQKRKESTHLRQLPSLRFVPLPQQREKEYMNNNKMGKRLSLHCDKYTNITRHFTKEDSQSRFPFCHTCQMYYIYSVKPILQLQYNTSRMMLKPSYFCCAMEMDKQIKFWGGGWCTFSGKNKLHIGGLP